MSLDLISTFRHGSCLSSLSDQVTTMSSKITRTSRPWARRGFTLVELLAVVAMIGILAALAIVGYRRYLNAAKSGEAKEIIGAIHVAQESYRGETLGYLDCSNGSLANYYPRKTPNDKKAHWINKGHGDYACWGMLNVATDSPTYYVFAVVAGSPGTAPPAPVTVQKPTWPSPTTEPWYIIQAQGDVDDNTKRSTFVSSSFQPGEIYAEDESE